MSGTLAPLPRLQEIDGNGAPYAGGKLYTYLAGTDTPATTYSNVTLATPNANPIIADASGRFGAIYLAGVSYKFVFKDTNGVTVFTQDNIPSTGITSVGIGLGQNFYGDPTVPIIATTYPSGTGYDTCHAGTTILPLDSANLSGTYVLGGMLRASGGVTVTAALVNLTDGSPDTPLVTITSGNATGVYVESGAITFPAGGASKNYAIKVKVSAAAAGQFGNAWGLSLIRTA